MDYRLEPNDLQLIYDWMDGKNPDGPLTETVQRFFRLSDALRGMLIKDRQTTVQQNKRLQQRVSKLTGEGRDEADEVAYVPAFEQLYYDGGMLLKIIMYTAWQQGLRITKDRGIHILYMLYASRLARANQRLIIEEPVANTRGPQFWSASKSFERYPAKNEAAMLVDKLKASDAGLYVHIVNAVKLYGKYPCNDKNDAIAKALMSSKPYLNACPKNNDGKWNGRILDEDIYRWRVKLKELL